MPCALGPLAIEFSELRFLAKHEGQGLTDFDELSDDEIIGRYLLASRLTTPTASYWLMPSPVALCREVLNAISPIASSTATQIYLVEDCEYSIAIEPIESCSDMLRITLCSPAENLLSWWESKARFLFELTGVLHAMRAFVSHASQLKLEDLISRCPAEVSWRCEPDA